jgi:hypothetical protein
MNFYMGAHAEDIRHLIIEHEGQDNIHVEDTTWHLVLEYFQYAIQKRIKAEWLREWIISVFTTTTGSDRMTANILMMGIMKEYSTCSGETLCGLPSVYLLGTKKDWTTIQSRLARPDDFGAEASSFRHRLDSVLSRFVNTFDEPDSDPTREF